MKANEMKRSGVGLEKIFLATGWFIGRDNKWRYQIEPIKIKPDVIKEAEKVKDGKLDFKEYKLGEILEENAENFKY